MMFCLKCSPFQKWLFWIPSLELTANAPENERLEDDRVLLGFDLFVGAKMLVSERVSMFVFGGVTSPTKLQ